MALCSQYATLIYAFTDASFPRLLLTLLGVYYNYTVTMPAAETLQKCRACLLLLYPSTINDSGSANVRQGWTFSWIYSTAQVSQSITSSKRHLLNFLLPFCCLKIHFNIILRCIPISSMWSSSFRFLQACLGPQQMLHVPPASFSSILSPSFLSPATTDTVRQGSVNHAPNSWRTATLKNSDISKGPCSHRYTHNLLLCTACTWGKKYTAILSLH